MPIPRRILAEDEEVLADLRPHWVYLAGPGALTAAAVAVAVTVVVEFPSAPVSVAWVLAAMIAVPALWLTGRVIRWLSISLVVTTTRIVFRHGVFSRDLVQVRLQRVADVHCHQRVIDRLIGSGRLVVELVGDQPMALDDVRRPRALIRVITRQLDELGRDEWRGGPDREGDRPTEPFGATRRWSSPPEDTPPHGVAVSTVPPAPAGPRGTFPPPSPSHDRAPTARMGPGPASYGADEPATTDDRPPSPPPGLPPSIPDQLIQLDDLRRRGIISEGEFASKKAELLDRL